MSQLNKKILYLEDDEFTRLLVQSQLERAGFLIDSFSTYTDFVTAVGEKSYDLIITDLNINGHNPTDLIRDMKTISGAPVVILSGSSKPVEQADLSITKPLTAEKIKEITGLLHHDPDDVDLSKVYQFACGDEDLLAQYVNTFITNYEEDLLMLKKEVQNDNIDAVRMRAHKMFSSVVYYGHSSLNNLFQQMELHTGPLHEGQLRQWFRLIEENSLNLIRNIQQKITV